MVSQTALYKDANSSLGYLIEDIRQGKLALPDIQRPFVWKVSKARDLLDSMYRGYPIGTLMFWETGAEVGTRQIGKEANRVAQRLIVDGQQRLTSLYAILTGSTVVSRDYKEQPVRIAFCPADERFEVTDAAIERDPNYLPDITALWRDGKRAVINGFLKRLAEARSAPLSPEEEDLLDTRLDRVHDLQGFRFQIIELGSQATEEQVAEIFVRINSEGVQLNQADFILTLMSVHWDRGRAELESFCRSATVTNGSARSARNAFIAPGPDQLLRAAIGLGFRRGRLQSVYGILRGKDLATGEISVEKRDAQFARLREAQAQVLDLTNWHEFLKCLTHAGFRSSKMVTSETTIIFSYIFWLIGRRDFGVDLGRLRALIARWFFMAHLTGRYTNSPESALESDLNRLESLPKADANAFCGELNREVDVNFTRDYWEISLPNRLDSSAARSPALFAYWAALNLLDAELLFSDVKVKDLFDIHGAAPRSLERHHLFPKAYLAKAGVTSKRKVNQIANQAFLDWPENSRIGAKAPADYWPLMVQKVPEHKLKSQVEWHALPVGWEQLDYNSFLENRRKLMASVVRRGFEILKDVGEASRPYTAVDDIIQAGESQRVEFKSTARWNVRAQQLDKKMEHVIVKTVCGFLNGEGGTLLIGVDDGGQILGLDDDFKTLGSKGDADGYELHLRQLLDNSLSIPTAGVLRISFETVQGKKICVVSVAAAAKPVFARSVEGGKEYTEFWVRIGNATKQMHGDDMMVYKKDHWG